MSEKSSSHHAWIWKHRLLSFAYRPSGKPELKPKLVTEKHKAGEFFHNLKEEIPFPAPNLFYKLNDNIMFAGIYSWRLGSRVIKHEFLNILRTCLKKEASSFLLSVTSRVCIVLNLSRAFSPYICTHKNNLCWLYTFDHRIWTSLSLQHFLCILSS